jgi:hypothetical protein
MFDTNPINSFNALVRNTGYKECNWHHEFSEEELALYKDEIEHCEDCNAPVIWSCCGIELDPSPEAGGTCPTCREHCL